MPPLLLRLELSFTAEVFNLSLKTRQNLSYAKSFTVDLHASDFTKAELYLSRPARGYELHVRGKNGEPRAQVVAQLQITLNTRADSHETQRFTLATDDAGLIHLGPLTGVSNI